MPQFARDLHDDDARAKATDATVPHILNVTEDAIFDSTKARQAGFTAMCRRSDASLLAHPADMRDRCLIP